MEELERKRKEAAEKARKEQEEAEERWKNESELERLEEEIQAIEDDAKEFGYEFQHDFEEEVPSIDAIEQEYKDLGGVTWDNSWEWLLFFRWVINALFVGVPFTIYSTFSVLWNIFLNFKFNRMWAGGNVYLIFNTVFMIVQTFNAFWLVLEVPAYLDWFKLSRVYSLEAAVVYNLVYAWFAYKLYTSVL